MTSEEIAARSAGAFSGRIGRAVLAIAAITVLSKVLGFVEKQVLAYYFGADLRVDAFIVAHSVPFLFFLLVRELIEPAFLPLFVQNLRAGKEKRGWRLFTLVALVILVVTVAYAGYAWTNADALAAQLAPKFGPEARERCAELIRLMIPAVVLLGLSSLTYITLNGYRRFALPACGDVALKAAPIVVCVLLVERLGVAALGVGFLVCAGLRLGVHAWGLGGCFRWLRLPDRASRSDVRLLALLTLPLVVGSAFSFVSELADNRFAAEIGEGGVSARAFAKKLKDMPIEVVPYTLSVVLFPFFAMLSAGGERRRLATVFTNSVHGLAILFTPLAVGMFVLAEPIVSLALERGAFDAAARELTAWPLRMYALGMVTFAVECVLVNFFFALRDTLTPIAIGLFGVGINIALCALLIEPLGVGGVALALTVSKSVKIIVLTLLLARKGSFVSWPAIVPAIVRLLFAGAVTALALTVLQARFPLELATASTADKATLLALGGALGGGLFFGVIALIGRRERTLMASLPGVMRAILARRGG